MGGKPVTQENLEDRPYSYWTCSSLKVIRKPKIIGALWCFWWILGSDWFKQKSVNLQAEVKENSALLGSVCAYGVHFKLTEILVMLIFSVGKTKASEAQAAGDKVAIQHLFQESPVQRQAVGASSAARMRLMALLSPTHSKPAVWAGLPGTVTSCDRWLLKLWEANKPKPLSGSIFPKIHKPAVTGLKQAAQSVDFYAHFRRGQGR